jgi:hypothetical protein
LPKYIELQEKSKNIYSKVAMTFTVSLTELMKSLAKQKFVPHHGDVFLAP